MEPYLWAQPAIGRVSKRVHWTPPKDIVDLVNRAGGEPDAKKSAGLYREFQKMLIDQANYIHLIQPIYPCGHGQGDHRLPADRRRVAGGPLRREAGEVDVAAGSDFDF